MEEIALPVEFFVAGVPVSHAASTPSRDSWKELVARAARATQPEAYFCTTASLAVSVFYFSNPNPVGDLDNIAKPILDALKGVLYVDDRQIDRLLIHRFPRGRAVQFDNPSMTLIAAIETEPPVVFIRVHDDLNALGS
ncbi:MAG: RusA family crossover junction endodeoxyribonuclease [Alphaproteobacteria bacterium]|nr:RusA family crossover junction endodeoxyribonuclease [Alphaproteobacteria bacterium]